MIHLAATIIVALVLMYFFTAVAYWLIDAYDGFSYRRWKKRHDAMTLDERIAEMGITLPESDPAAPPLEQ